MSRYRSSGVISSGDRPSGTRASVDATARVQPHLVPNMGAATAPSGSHTSRGVAVPGGRPKSPQTYIQGGLGQSMPNLSKMHSSPTLGSTGHGSRGHSPRHGGSSRPPSRPPSRPTSRPHTPQSAQNNINNNNNNMASQQSLQGFGGSTRLFDHSLTSAASDASSAFSVAARDNHVQFDPDNEELDLDMESMDEADTSYSPSDTESDGSNEDIFATGLGQHNSLETNQSNAAPDGSGSNNNSSNSKKSKKGGIWIECRETESGRILYYNSKSHEIVFDKPPRGSKHTGGSSKKRGNTAGGPPSAPAPGRPLPGASASAAFVSQEEYRFLEQLSESIESVDIVDDNDIASHVLRFASHAWNFDNDYCDVFRCQAHRVRHADMLPNPEDVIFPEFFSNHVIPKQPSFVARILPPSDFATVTKHWKTKIDIARTTAKDIIVKFVDKLKLQGTPKSTPKAAPAGAMAGISGMMGGTHDNARINYYGPRPASSKKYNFGNDFDTSGVDSNSYSSTYSSSRRPTTPAGMAAPPNAEEFVLKVVGCEEYILYDHTKLIIDYEAVRRAVRNEDDVTFALVHRPDIDDLVEEAHRIEEEYKKDFDFKYGNYPLRIKSPSFLFYEKYGCGDGMSILEKHLESLEKAKLKSQAQASKKVKNSAPPTPSFGSTVAGEGDFEVLDHGAIDWDDADMENIDNESIELSDFENSPSASPRNRGAASSNYAEFPPPPMTLTNHSSLTLGANKKSPGSGRSSGKTQKSDKTDKTDKTEKGDKGKRGKAQPPKRRQKETSKSHVIKGSVAPAKQLVVKPKSRPLPSLPSQATKVKESRSEDQSQPLALTKSVSQRSFQDVGASVNGNGHDATGPWVSRSVRPFHRKISLANRVNPHRSSVTLYTGITSKSNQKVQNPHKKNLNTGANKGNHKKTSNRLASHADSNGKIPSPYGSEPSLKDSSWLRKQIPSIATSMDRAPRAILLEEFDQHYKIRINGLSNVTYLPRFKQGKTLAVVVRCELWMGTLSWGNAKFDTPSIRRVSNSMRFSDWFEQKEIKYSHLPREATLSFTVVGLSPNEDKSNKSKVTETPLAYCRFPIIDHRHCLRNGQYRLNLWPIPRFKKTKHGVQSDPYGGDWAFRYRGPTRDCYVISDRQRQKRTRRERKRLRIKKENSFRSQKSKKKFTMATFVSSSTHTTQTTQTTNTTNNTLDHVMSPNSTQSSMSPNSPNSPNTPQNAQNARKKAKKHTMASANGGKDKKRTGRKSKGICRIYFEFDQRAFDVVAPMIAVGRSVQPPGMSKTRSRSEKNLNEKNPRKPPSNPSKRSGARSRAQRVGKAGVAGVAGVSPGAGGAKGAISARGSTNTSDAEDERKVTPASKILSDSDWKRVHHVITRDALASLDDEEKELIWKARDQLVHVPDALPTFLRSVDWRDPWHRGEAYQYLRQWQPPSYLEDALELLTYEFADTRVREYGVMCIANMHDSDLQRYLLQLVQCLKFELHHNNALIRLLMRRGLMNRYQIGHFLFWHLMSEYAGSEQGCAVYNNILRRMSKKKESRRNESNLSHASVTSARGRNGSQNNLSPSEAEEEDYEMEADAGADGEMEDELARFGNFEWCERFGLYIEEYLLFSTTHARELLMQYNLMSRLQMISKKIYYFKKYENMDSALLKAKLARYLAEFNKSLPNMVSMPLNPRWRCTHCVVERCRYMSSAQVPLWIEFANADSNADNIKVLFKAGDDLRQDILTLQVLRVMDKVWLDRGLNLRLLPYNVVSTGNELGMVEIVLNSETTNSIHCDYGGGPQKGARDITTHVQFLKEHNRASHEFEKARDNYLRSAAGYCVATYVLGIGDRHPDNIMIRKTGELFHIDFGHFLGNFKSKKIGGIKFNREKSPFVFLPAMKYVIEYDYNTDNSGHKELYHKFVEYCLGAYSALRVRHRLLFNLFLLMVPSVMPELVKRKDIEYMREQLHLYDVPADDVSDHISKVLKKCLNDKTRLMDNAFHAMKHAH